MIDRNARLAAAAAFLLSAAIPDTRTKKIPVWIPALFAVAALPANLLCPCHIERMELLTGMVPGLALLALSLGSEQKIGRGDGICLTVCGAWAGMEYTLFIAAVAMLLAGLTGAVCVLTRKKRADDRIAFVPFLAVAAVILLICESALFRDG